MDQLDKSEIRSIIKREIQKTEEQVAEYKELTKPIEPENSIGRISRMDAINNKSIVDAALRQQNDKLYKLNLVLSKINDEDFGICLSCKKQIPLGRILIMPQSQTCVSCSH